MNTPSRRSLLLLVFAALAAIALLLERRGPAPGAAASEEDPAAVADAAHRLDREVAALAPQRPGHPDLFVLGVAGDGSERVFLNEVRHLHALATTRLDARGRVLLLANHPPEPPYERPVPATPATVRTALAGIGAAMDPGEDVLLLYVTTHGSPDHRLLLRRDGRPDAFLDAPALRAALDDAGIRHRVLALSACYAGGLAPALQTRDTLVLAAAHAGRPSFGCGTDSVATFFGRAWLVDGLNATVDFAEAFRRARTAIRERERAGDYEPSRPQMRIGAAIGARLAAWRAAFRPGPPRPYPHPEPVGDDAGAATAGDDRDGPIVVPPWLPFDPDVSAAPRPGDDTSPPP